MASPEPDLTRLLRHFDPADPQQATTLLPLVYGELRRMAASQLSRERLGHDMQPTDLVHEAYLRLSAGLEMPVESRRQFYGILARTMRQVLVDHARRRDAEKRGGGWERVSLHTSLLHDEGRQVELLDLDRVLRRLGEMDETLGRLVELRFFAGMTVDEAAGALGVSPRKAAKDWAAARLWLARELEGQGA